VWLSSCVSSDMATEIFMHLLPLRQGEGEMFSLLLFVAAVDLGQGWCAHRGASVHLLAQGVYCMAVVCASSLLCTGGKLDPKGGLADSTSLATSSHGSCGCAASCVGLFAFLNCGLRLHTWLTRNGRCTSSTFQASG
jgi:hypothetical protein